jgi:catalase
MQAALDSVQKTGAAVADAMASNKKTTDMKQNIREPSANIHLTSDFGVKQTTHDISLSASTGDRKGPALLEDNFSREKVSAYFQRFKSYRLIPV